MCDAFDVLPRDFLHATYEHDEDTPPAALLRPTTPLPDRTRTLRRTISYASIDTVCPVNSSSKGIRRRINDIAENLKNKSTKKKKKDSSAQDVPKNATHGRGSESNAKQASRGTKRGRKATAPLRDSSHRSEEEKVLAAADWLHSGVPSEQDTPSTFLGCESDPLVDEPPLREDEQPWEDDLFPTWSLEPTHVTADGQSIFKPPQTPKIGINDVQLDTRPSESDVTIWDGLRASVFSFFPLANRYLCIPSQRASPIQMSTLSPMYYTSVRHRLPPGYPSLRDELLHAPRFRITLRPATDPPNDLRRCPARLPQERQWTTQCEAWSRYTHGPILANDTGRRRYMGLVSRRMHPSLAPVVRQDGVP